MISTIKSTEHDFKTVLIYNFTETKNENSTLEKEQIVVASKKNKVRVSKLARCDPSKINDYNRLKNRLGYVYAGELGSKIPRLNGQNEELY